MGSMESFVKHFLYLHNSYIGSEPSDKNEHMEVIVYSMTAKERGNAEIIGGSKHLRLGIRFHSSVQDASVLRKASNKCK
jgi:signal recognition particle GTPase